VKTLASLLLDVNTLIVTRQSKSDITASFRSARGLFSASQQHSARLRAALRPFIATQTTLPGPARQALSQATALANKYGLDRVAGLLSKGRTRELFQVTAETATYAGAAEAGLNKILALVQAHPSSTTAQVKKLDNLRDTVGREKQAQELEALRSYSESFTSARETLTARLEQIKETILPAKEVAAFLDSTNGYSIEAKAEDIISNAIPNYANNQIMNG
jgi:hypothetical protein